MADDPAFVWDSGRPARPLPPPQPRSEASPDGYVTLREAEEATGVPATTIRNWARKERVPSNVEVREAGPRRMVDLQAVTERARMLGRLPEARTPPAGPAAVPDDHVLVPMDAWEKMLLQLGNLHEAGQDLATARERAAKAETEAAFLRERIAELREERDELKDAAAGPTEPPAPEQARPPAPTPATWWDRSRAWIRRARGTAE